MTDVMGFCIICALLLINWQLVGIKNALQREQAAGGSAAGGQK